MVHPGLRVDELVELIERQEIQLPDFQRGYVWKRPQVLKFIDSLYMGYPTGQILLWIPPQEAYERMEALGSRSLDAPPGGGSPGERSRASAGGSYPPQFVLDGQQRLTSLYRLLKGDEGWRLRFHVEEGVFASEVPSLLRDPRWVSVGDILRSDKGLSQALVRLQKELKLSVEDPTYERYQAALQRLSLVRQRTLAVEVVRIGDVEQVTELFVRINSGTPLKRAELALAQLAWRWPGALLGRFSDAVEEFQDMGFDLTPAFLMRCYVGVATGQATFTHLESLWKLNDVTLAKNWDRTYIGLRGAFAFVQEVARFPSGEDLPSLNALVPIVALFANDFKADAAQTQKLLYWFLVASAFGRYGSSVESRLAEDLKAIHTEQPLESLLGVLARTTPQPATVPAADLAGKGQGSHAFFLLQAMSRLRGVHDWFPATAGRRPGGRRRGDGDLVVHPLYSRAALVDGRVDEDLSEELANLVLLPRRPPARATGTRPEQLLPKLDPALLAEQWIPTDKTLWYAARMNDFLAARRELLAQSFSAALESLAEGKPPKF